MCRPGRKDALGRTKRSPKRGGQSAVKLDTLIPRPHLSTKPGQAQSPKVRHAPTAGHRDLSQRSICGQLHYIDAYLRLTSKKRIFFGYVGSSVRSVLSPRFETFAAYAIMAFYPNWTTTYA